jgi:hypothetical protein
MSRYYRCPLAEHQLGLLGAAVQLRTCRSRVLAEALSKSEDTVHTDFARICRVLGAGDRAGAVLIAMAHGWVPSPRVTVS